MADTERDKNAKRMQNTLASMGVNGMGHIGLQAAAYYQVCRGRGSVGGASTITGYVGGVVVWVGPPGM